MTQVNSRFAVDDIAVNIVVISTTTSQPLANIA